MLDERLSLAASLYQPCEWGADVGTDHGFLPCHLLETGVCRQMILADVSPKALEKARAQVRRRGLESRAELVCADGLDALTRPCGCVSLMGMGGETLAEILLRGREKLRGAALVLSAHTELHLVRSAVQAIGYTITHERLCRAAGRFYVFWRAEPGEQAMTEEELRHGRLLFREEPELLKAYLVWRKKVLEAKLQGLKKASVPDEAALSQARADVQFYEKMLEV